MKMPDKNPDLWAQLIAWLAAHKEGGGYAATAALMALLRSAYVGKQGWTRRLIDAAMCAMVAYFIKDCLAAIGWDSTYAYLGSMFIGYAGVDYFGNMLRRIASNRTGSPRQE
ncbi:phage holin, lambda family [Serratia sp. CY37345]|uniref:phage holin, lambda family n=1 Tax=Serratia sp. CY37345 TaxID=3383610 RepID=UPI003FA0A6F2